MLPGTFGLSSFYHFFLMSFVIAMVEFTGSDKYSSLCEGNLPRAAPFFLLSYWGLESEIGEVYCHPALLKSKQPSVVHKLLASCLLQDQGSSGLPGQDL